MKKFLAILLLGLSNLVTAQTVQTTPNLITSGTNHTWTGVTTSSTVTGGGYSGGNQPAYNPGTNTVYFGYNTTTVGQTIAINNALQGSGVQVGGYNYSWSYLNNSNTGGTLSAAVKLTSPSGSTLEQYTYAMNTIQDGWRTMSGSQDFNQQYGLADVGNLRISFTGKDARWWAGYYGPQVKDVNLSLKYTVDPCVANPAYSPTCANYNTVNFSNNLVPNPNAYATYGSSIDQSYAISQALALSGSNIMIHGFQWGYVANANGPYCNSWLVVCWDQRNPSVTTNVNITDNSGSSLYNISRTYTNSYNTTNYQYLFPTSRNLSTLGRFNFTATANDAAYIGSVWSKAVYTPDPCADPLSSPSCPGYQQAYMTQQCTANPLYNSACPGYAQALFTQQCTANQLSNPACPGYANAYLTQQCSINPLYSTTCSGYETAYFNQQCTADPLYNSRCPGYTTAYHDQQCGINPLYATDCAGYSAAYLTQQCNANPLYSTQCSGYAVAYKNQQCTASPLYATDCPGYAVAYKNQQCSASALYATDCPGYAAAYKTQQCTASALYATDCPGYDVAYKTQQCTANPLYATDCPGYAAAYKNQQCSLNALYATDCVGYQQAYFSQQCTANGLYSNQCPNYAEAYAKKNVLNISTTPTATVAAATTTTVSTTAPSVESSGEIKIAVVADSNVNSVITATAISASPAQAATATVPLVAPAPAPAAPAPEPAKKADAAPATTTTAQSSQDTGSSKPQPTAREALQERRREAAQKEAIAKGKDLANEMGKAADMEAQKAVQNVVIQAMGFTPGFDTYNKSTIPDANIFYKPYQVYGGQVNVDNRNASRRLMGGSDKTHQDLVDSQFNLGK